MKTIFTILIIVAGSFALEKTTRQPTGPTVPPVECPDYLCQYKSDGNYPYTMDYYKKAHYFVQCVNGKAYCQGCWPLTLYFKEECNQCVYDLKDVCYTTKSWIPQPTFKCPNICKERGPDFEGNIADPNEKRHYVGCWRGTTVGCVRCPGKLLFNEKENKCLYDGIHFTEPLNDYSK